MIEFGYEKNYVEVSLQLSNNETTAGLRLIDHIQRRVRELNGTYPHSEQTLTATCIPGENTDDSNWEVIDVKCPVCKDENASKADQIIPCNGCQRVYHTFCVGLRRIPFGCKTEKDQLIRDKYIKRHLGEWKCSICTNTKTSKSDGSNEPGDASKIIHNQCSNDSFDARLPSSPARRSKQDQIAILTTALSSDGIDMEELIKMNEEQQREVIRATMLKRYPELMLDSSQESKGSLDLATAMQGILSHNDFQNHKLLSAKAVLPHPSIVATGNLQNQTFVNEQLIHNETKINRDEQTSITRANMLEVIKRRAPKGENNMLTIQPSVNTQGNPSTHRMIHTGIFGDIPPVVGNFGMNMTAATVINPTVFPGYAPYFSLSSAGQGSYSVSNKLSNPELNSSSEITGGESNGPPSTVAVNDIPEYNKYFRMIKVLLSS